MNLNSLIQNFLKTHRIINFEELFYLANIVKKSK